MPRRPSASVGAPSNSSTPSTSTIVVHRTTESHHVFTSIGASSVNQPSVHSTYNSNPQSAPQQRIVQVLVNRLRQKLPSSSGLSLDRVEADQPTQRAIEALVELSKDSLDMIAWALCELLDSQNRPDPHNSKTVEIDVLQSQLFILKVLSVAMASRWSQNETSSPDSPYSSTRPVGSSEYSTSSTLWREPPPLIDSCAKYILSVMVLLLRQSASTEVPLMLQVRSTDLSFRDFDDNIDLNSPPDQQKVPPEEPGLRTRTSSNSFKSSKMSVNSAVHIAATNTVYEKTHLSLLRSSDCVNHLIAKFVGRIIFHISASNWNVVSERLSSKLSNLAAHPEAHSDTVDLHLISYSLIDKQRLVILLNQLSSLLLEMKDDAQRAITAHLRTAVWNWIDIFPQEFNDVILSRGRTEGAPERVFDLLFSMTPTGGERIFWPTLTVLHCMASERITSDYRFGMATSKGRKEVKFTDSIIKHIQNSSKFSEISLVCAVDICRAATYIDTSADVPLRSLSYDVAHEIRTALYKCGTSRKPFWESYDDIDVALYADALVAIFRFLPEEESKPLFQACVEPERSDPVKTVVVRACLTLVQDASRFSWQKPLDNLELAVSGRFRDILKHAGTQRQNEVEYNGIMKRIASRPMAKRYLPEPLSEREVLILSILSLWRENLGFFMKVINKENIDNWVTVIDKLWVASIDTSVKISTARCMTKITERSITATEVDNNDYRMIDIVKAAMPVTLITVSSNLLTSRDDPDKERLCISVAHQVMEFYSMKSDLEYMQLLQNDPNRIPAFAMAEVAFLVELTSADNDISHLAAKGLRLLAYAERQTNAPVNTSITEEDRSKRNPIYEQLGDPRITIAGRLGHQKRIRKLVRLLRFSAGTHLVVWEECYWRWRALNECINNALNEAVLEGDSPKNHSPIAQQDIRFQWHNLTLFLAALGGTCLEQGIDVTALAKVIPPHSLPDKIRVSENPLPLIEGFISDLIKLLVAGDIQIRDIVREALGTELSPRLYVKLLRNLEQKLFLLHKNTGDSALIEDHHALLLEQIVSLLKLVADNTESTIEDLKNVDLGMIIESIGSFVTRVSESSAHRIKLKFCALCESVCDRVDTLALRRDSTIRHEILNYILQWMVPSKDFNDSTPTTVIELNMACLRATVKLLDRLPLRTSDTSNQGDEVTHVVSRLFNKYSTALLSCIGSGQPEKMASDSASELGSVHQKIRASQKEAESRELVITGLAHLVSANSENGFRQCLPLAYDSDNRRRSIFAHVFSRVIGQGTVFDQPEKLDGKPRQSALCDLVRSPDMVLAMTICEACPPAEVEIMISVLLNIFNTRATLVPLLKLMIEREVAQTDNQANLFRGNSICTRFLTAFARLHGYQYLRGLVQPLIDVMLKLPPGSGFEIDPNKAMGQDVAQNQANVEYVASLFLEIVSGSMPALPGMFKEICTHISRVVADVWPEAKYAAVGAFIFLRFISPAVVTPEIVDIEIPKGENSPALRRGLMVMAKILQNLANNIFFGKEPHMASLNTFLESNISPLTRFLQALLEYIPLPEDMEPWDGATLDDTDAVVLHRFFHKHADKIGKELLSLSKPTVDGESSVIIGKRAWDLLCALLVDLGPPMDAPHLSTQNSSQHQEYLELMSMYANHSTASVEDLFLETEVQDTTAVFILRLSKIDVENLDVELFMYHILKTLSSPAYESRHFDIILDCTCFTPTSEVPLQWLKYCAELVPKDIRSRFAATRILSPNILTQKYLRRLYNVAAGVPFCNEVKIYTSVMQLMADVRTTALAPLAYPVSLEQESHETFTDILMKTPTKVPVIFRIGSSHIRVTSVRAMPISPGLSCKSTELIPLAEISDCYNVSTGTTEQNEFIIRRRQGHTTYFLCPAREHVVKAIRAAKGKLKEATAPLTERFLAFSNVAATLLHIGLLSVDLDDEELRGAAYDLLGAVCKYLKYDKSPIIASKAGFISGDPVAFVSGLSKKIANFAPQLTLDFIHEVSSAMTNMNNSDARRITCLQYLSPWIKNLSFFANPTHPLHERSGARLRDCIRTLTDISVAFPDITSSIQKHIWNEISKLDSGIVEVVLSVLVRCAMDGGIGTRRCETMCLIVAALSSITVRGKIYSRLRKTLCMLPLQVHTNKLTEHTQWNELATLIRLSYVVGSQSDQAGITYLYVPEILHLICLTAGEGPSLVRKSAYGTVVNLLQSLYIARQDDSTEPGIMELINECSLPETLRLFGLKRETPTGEYFNFDSSNERIQLDLGEQLIQFLIRIVEVSAGTRGLINVWKARWMSLVTSTAFQQTPAIQTRSFVVLSALATAEVDDDYLYQILVAFQSALERADETNTTSLVSMLRCMWKVLPTIQESRYAGVLFWLAVSLLQASHLGFYVEAACLLRASLENLEKQGVFKELSVPEALLICRQPLEGVASELDDMLRISFERNFTFSLSAIIFKGMRHSGLRPSAEAALRTLLRVTTVAEIENEDISSADRNIISPDVLGYFLALIPVTTTTESYQQLLEECEYNIQDGLDAPSDLERQVPRLDLDTLGINDPDTALLVTSFVGTILTSAQGDDAETQILYDLLASIAVAFPQIIAITYETMQERIKDIFANSSNPSIVRSVCTILRVALQDPGRSHYVSRHGSASTLNTIDEIPIGPGRTHILALEELGMQGLANSFTFLPPNKGHSTKMIKWIPTLVTLILAQDSPDTM